MELASFIDPPIATHQCITIYMQEAVKGEFWRLRDPQGKPPGVMGWWPSRAVTFLDNHDTGSTQVLNFSELFLQHFAQMVQRVMQQLV